MTRRSLGAVNIQKREESVNKRQMLEAESSRPNVHTSKMEDSSLPEGPADLYAGYREVEELKIDNYSHIISPEEIREGVEGSR